MSGVDGRVSGDDKKDASKTRRSKSPGSDGKPPSRASKAPGQRGNDPRLIAALVGAITIAAFLGGYTLGGADDGGPVSQEVVKDVADVLPSTPSAVTISADGDPLLGNPAAPVTIIEFSDFQCPFCARFHTNTLPLIESEYIEKGLVNMVYRDMPLQNHANARPVHIAAECAGVQGSFWEYHDILFERQAEWRSLNHVELDAKIKDYAGELELDSSFDSCIRSADIVQEIDGDITDARSYGVRATPTFFIGTADKGYFKLEGAKPFEEFKNIIDSLLT